MKRKARQRLQPRLNCSKALLKEVVNAPMTPAEAQHLMLAFDKAVVERAMGTETNLHRS